MPRRSITDEEIGLIKAMLSRGMINRDIQFYFNRQDRPVNSGRITQIRQGTYGPEAPEATAGELDAFLATFEAADVGVIVNGNDVAERQSTADLARARFERRDDGNWFLADGETSDQECKLEFDPTRLNPIIKAIAGLANNQGGFVFIGVSDEEHRAIGLPDDRFRDTDIVRIVDKVKTFLTPTPVFSKCLIDLDGAAIGVIHVEKLSLPPVIVCKDGDGLTDGTILFRYPGQSARIKYGDLLAMLRERDRSANSLLLSSAAKLSSIGTDKALIVDTGSGTLDAGEAKITIDRELVDQLEFIREGEFEEREGAPTLRLIGDVRALGEDGEVRERVEGRALTADGVLLAFLKQEQVRSPLDYICVSATVQRQWLPVHYFVRISGQDIQAAIDQLEATRAVYRNSKQNALERLRGQRSAYRAPSRRSAEIVPLLIRNEFAEAFGQFGDFHTVQAIQSLNDDFVVEEGILRFLEAVFDRAQENANLKSALFRAAARVDELMR